MGTCQAQPSRLAWASAERERLNLTTANVYAELALILNVWLAAEKKQGLWVTPVELLFLVPLDNIFRFTY